MGYITLLIFILLYRISIASQVQTRTTHLAHAHCCDATGDTPEARPVPTSGQRWTADVGQYDAECVQWTNAQRNGPAIAAATTNDAAATGDVRCPRQCRLLQSLQW